MSQSQAKLTGIKAVIAILAVVGFLGGSKCVKRPHHLATKCATSRWGTRSRPNGG